MAAEGEGEADVEDKRVIGGADGENRWPVRGANSALGSWSGSISILLGLAGRLRPEDEVWSRNGFDGKVDCSLMATRDIVEEKVEVEVEAEGGWKDCS